MSKRQPRMSSWASRLLSARRNARAHAQPETPLTSVRDVDRGVGSGVDRDVDRAQVKEKAEKEPYISPALKTAAAWSWRFLVVGGAVAAVLWLLSRIPMILLPCLVGLLLAALMAPPVSFLVRHKWPRALASGIVFIGCLLIVAGLITFTGQQIVVGFPALADQVILGFNQLTNFVQHNPFGLDSRIIVSNINSATDNVMRTLQDSQGEIATGALGAASSVSNFVTGLLITLFAAYFFVYDGGRIFAWFVRMLPKPAQAKAVAASVNGWKTLVQYVRVQVLVAAIDAVGIGLGAVFLGIPLAFPLTVLVFLGSFVPLVGAVLTGVIAVVVALVSKGLFSAIVMVVVVIAVQQIEGNVLQPFLMGKAVSVHPLAVVLAVTGGGVLFGIAGALFSVPFIAVMNTFVMTLAGDSAYSLKAAEAMKNMRNPDNSAAVRAAKRHAKKLLTAHQRGSRGSGAGSGSSASGSGVGGSSASGSTPSPRS